jgi:ATP-binding cassette subfamily C protein CydD
MKLGDYASRHLLAYSVGFGFLAGACAIGICWQVATALNLIVHGHATATSLLPGLGIAIAFATARAGFSALQARYSVQISAQAKSQLRTTFFPQSAPGIPFASSLSLWHRGIEALDPWYALYLPQKFLAGLVPLLILGFAFWADWLSGIVFLVTAPLLPVFLILIGMTARDKSKKQWKLLAQQGNLYLETLLGLRTLKLFGRSQHWKTTLLESAETLRHATLTVLRLAFLSAFVLEMVGTLGTAIVAVEIGLRLLRGGLEFREAFFVLLLAPEFYFPLRQLGLRTHAAMEGESVAQKLFQVPVSSDSQPANDPSLPMTPSSLLELDSASARYPGQSKDAFSAMSLKVNPTDCIAITGPSGCGKSSLMATLLGQLDLREGTLARRPNLRLLWIPQHPRVYHRSLRANLWNLPQVEPTLAGDHILFGALEKVGLDLFVRNLPLGLDTLAGEGGTRLSGGQIRRLALARAFIQPVDIVLLDEPDAHLDQASLDVLDLSIQALATTSACIFVTHRDASLALANQVIRMESPP